MPEYLAPGVYVEEVSFRAKTIEGVSTSVTAFVGSTRYGPVGDVPELLTGFADFDRIYGGLDPLQFGDETVPNFLALAVRAFYDNGGTKLYITRVYNPPAVGTGIAAFTTGGAGPVILQARFPGSGGNMRVFFTARLSQSLISNTQPDIRKSVLKENDLVFVVSKNVAATSGFYDVVTDAGTGKWKWTNADGVTTLAEALILPANMDVYQVKLAVSVRKPGRFEAPEPIGVFSANPLSADALQTYFVASPPSRERFLTQPFFIQASPASGAAVAGQLLGSVTSALQKQGIPAMKDLTLTALLTLDPGYLKGLGFDDVKLKKFDPTSLSLAAFLQFSRDALTKLGIGALKDLTADTLKKATGADVKALTDAINLRLLQSLTAVPFDKLTIKALAALKPATLTGINITKATLTGYDPQTLTLQDVQALPATALNKLKILSLKTVTPDQLPPGIDLTKKISDLAALDDAALAPLGVTKAILVAVNNAALGPLTLSELLVLPTATLASMSLDKVAAAPVAKLQTPGDATDLSAVANAVGIADLSGATSDYLTLLTLADLQKLTVADPNPALPLGVTLAGLTGVNVAKLQTLTLADLKTLPITALQALGADILRTVDSLLPLKPSDLTSFVDLIGGSDGLRPTSNDYKGADPVGPADVKTGLRTFMDIDEVSIVAAPGSSYIGNPPLDAEKVTAQGVALELITHCELMRYRVAVLDMPNQQILSEARAYRSIFDSKYAAIYYPWVTILDPLDPAGRAEIDVPPSGFVTGIYARNDAERSVSKAPANEVLRGAIGLEFLLNKAQQDILNPDGIDCFRFFPERGLRLWGARTLSSDSEWKYINVRRYFAYLEHSIDKGTQFVVFENNNQRLWDNVRTTIEGFLFNEWRNNNLMGLKPPDAYFVRCDRSTMTQNDIDNGRLVCLIGVSVNKPAEYVIFRIGQMTADSTS